MRPVRPEFVPDSDAPREEMEAVQREVADAATFADDTGTRPVEELVEGPLGGGGGPLVAGIDQAFLDDRAVSAIVVVRGGRIVDRATAITPITIPYIPGLLSFREGGPILAAVDGLDVEPDLLLFDGSGRIHYRQAGLATHLGVVLDAPSIGVAKGLLCGSPRSPLDDLPAGARVPIEADGTVDAPDGTLIGYALQTRQFASGDRRINPVYVSPGHRVSAATAAEVVLATCSEYKLPDPIRLADQAAEDAKVGSND